MPIFAKRHYEAIATNLRDTYEQAKCRSLTEGHAVESSALSLCRLFMRDNDKFNARRFIQACGMPNLAAMVPGNEGNK